MDEPSGGKFGNQIGKDVRLVDHRERLGVRDHLHTTADARLRIAVEPEIRQLMLLDAPSILGWAGFREVSQRYGLGMTEQLLSAAIDCGELKPQPTRPLATIVLAALDEAAMIIANARDPVRESHEVHAVIHDLIDGLLVGAGTDRSGPRASGAGRASRGGV
jgi:predicted nuclease with RNAse H fold